ncbi:DUF2252 domain-containing protein [Rhodococcus sp. IEGM 1379]|nr:DUF2252 domain-containing protein [Rhodococcus sp. IEGM 1379]MDI9914150.1 DUF2252 domain-containing protein [Rhodococcus sp. IEGM 1379]
MARPRTTVVAPEAQRSGKSARKIVARSQLALWDESERGHDSLATILAQNAIRAQDLLPIRHGRMAASPWTYFRGAAAVMAADLGSAPNTGIGVQLCGDAHVLNFGLWATPERNLSFDLRDFDETLPGPFEWDVKRLAASIVVLARENGVSEERADAATVTAVSAYRDKMHDYASTPEIDIWYDRIDVGRLLEYFAPDTARRAEKIIETKAQRRTSRGASRKLTETVDGRRRIREDPPFRTHVGNTQVELVTEVVAGYSTSVPDHIWSLLSRYQASDVVRQVVGVGSVGMRVYLALLEEHRTGDPFFLQIKQAGSSVYESCVEPSRYSNHGERVVQGQRMIQSATDMFVGWTTVGDMDFYVRQFRDMKVIPDGATIGPYLAEFASACGEVLARAHARSGDANAISEYLGRSDKAVLALSTFARRYADQNERDHAQLVAAIANGSVPSAPGW